jgi:uncharacterized protein with PIN domain
MIVDTSALIAIAWDEPERAQFQDAIEADPIRLVSAAHGHRGRSHALVQGPVASR